MNEREFRDMFEKISGKTLTLDERYGHVGASERPRLYDYGDEQGTLLTI